jgi:hypothetical protein
VVYDFIEPFEVSVVYGSAVVEEGLCEESECGEVVGELSADGGGEYFGSGSFQVSVLWGADGDGGEE